MREPIAWGRFRKGFPGYCERIEDRQGKGVADVCWVLPDGTTGWVELKAVDRAPMRACTIGYWGVDREQVLFGSRWVRKGGAYGLLVMVGEEFWAWRDLPRYSEGVGSWEEWKRLSVWNEREGWDGLPGALRGGPGPV